MSPAAHETPRGEIVIFPNRVKRRATSGERKCRLCTGVYVPVQDETVCEPCHIGLYGAPAKGGE